MEYLNTKMFEGLDMSFLLENGFLQAAEEAEIRQQECSDLSFLLFA
ncbi:hypothetical protein [Ileibacterium valens]|nr:hypothetical protein [Ileibacterium valens]